MQTTKERTTDKIETRLQFTITILTFFLVLFPVQQLAGCIVVAAYVIDYIIFAVRSDKISEKHLRWINVSILIGIGSYIIPLAILALSTQDKTIPFWQVYIWMTSTYASMVIMIIAPIAILVELFAFGINRKR
ncbi:MAG: hypothetical protein NTZ38_03565 [Candidatus Taylorbacteria bacterium]|nr:hypothetical protein [Candidatus Taylorbacteria bacterium]